MHLFKYSSILLISIAFLASSCFKEEKPVPLPPQGDALSQSVNIGNQYNLQVYYSFTNGIVKEDSFSTWDISFDVHPTQNELWLNGGSNILVYPSGQSNFNATLPTGLTKFQWLYDHPVGTSGNSALGQLNNTNHIGELLFLQKGKNIYKLKILEVTADYYQILIGNIADSIGTEVLLQKDQQYNFVYYSFNSGIVQPEPIKTEWDMVFTRYRTIFEGLDDDGSDLPYLVNGVLLNTYNTLGASDSTKEKAFSDFSLQDTINYPLSKNRDIIGHNWKLVNINTAEYTILPKRMFLLKDQFGQLWKFHFVSFYDKNGQRGHPQFEYKRIN